MAPYELSEYFTATLFQMSKHIDMNLQNLRQAIIFSKLMKIIFFLDGSSFKESGNKYKIFFLFSSIINI